MGKGRLLSNKQSPPAHAPNQPPSKKQEQQGTMLEHRGVSQEQRCKRGLETGVSFCWRQRQETDGLTFDSFQGEVAVSRHTSAMITAQRYVHTLVKKSILISLANGCGEP
ncbi:hypothetical protein AOLI_G00121090 [Acnodon oligacanthus]